MAPKQISKTFGRSRQKEPLQLPLLESLTRFKLKNQKTPSAAAPIKDNAPIMDDPYDFVDSQSLQPTSSKMPRTSIVSPSANTTRRTPRSSSSNRKQQRTPKTPAEVKMDQLRQKEKEDLERALEESRKEADKEERRRRRERREAAEAMDKEKVNVMEDISTSSEPIENAPSDIPAVQSQAEVKHQSCGVVTVQQEHTADPEENCNQLSQSTPPLEGSRLSTPLLNGGRQYSSDADPHIKSHSLSRTPILRVTKFSNRLEKTDMSNISSGGVSAVSKEWNDVGSEDKDEWLADTPPLIPTNDRDSTQDGVGIVLESNTNRVLRDVQSETTNSHQSRESSTHTKRLSLLLSLKKGKRRLSSELGIELESHQSCKKTRIDETITSDQPLNDTVATNNHTSSCVDSGSGQQEDVQQTHIHSLPLTQENILNVSVPHTRKKLPDMFAPEGEAPGHYMSTILNVFNSYIHQLKIAQSRVMFRIPWGTPIPSHHHQPLTTLTYYTTPRHHHYLSTRITHEWPVIDLKTGEVIRLSPPQPRRSTVCSSNSLRTQRRKRRAAAFAEDDDFSSGAVSKTPSRKSNLSRREDKGTTASTSQWFVPPVDPPSGRAMSRSRSVSVPAHSTSPVDPSHDTTPMITNDGFHNTSLPENHQQEQDGEENSPTLSTTVALEESSCSTTAVELDQSSTAAETVHHSFSISEPSLGSTNIVNNEREERLTNQMSSSDDESVVGKRSTHKSCKRRAAHILDDSDSETEEENNVIVAKNRTGEQSRSIFASARETFGFGKSLKKYSLKKLSVKAVKYSKPDQLVSEDGSKSVIDLTDDPHNPTNHSPPSPVSRVVDKTKNWPVDLDPEGEDTVTCPLCNKRFTSSTIETHAASCQDSPSPVLNRTTTTLPLKQTTLLTPRFNRRSHVLLSSSSSSSPDPPSSSVLQQQEEDYAELERDEDEILEEEENCGSSNPGSLQVYEREDGGYQVDPSTISNSPIKTFRRISDLDPTERAGYYDQFTKKTRRSRGQIGRGRVTMETTTTGDYISSRRGRGKGKGKQRGGWRGFRKRNNFRGKGRKN